MTNDPRGERLQKVLAHAGVGSRRYCEVLMEQGRIEVDGQIVTELGTRVDPAKVSIHVDGMPVQIHEDKLTLALYKPPGVVSTKEDEKGRPS
ncbi:S4 domain-containing protein [Ancrocorticia populi]|uniref:S4 domain-containing protein n=1 Tax=Ancrocorticia populi TaxID=2175228 RepID=UPI003F9A5A27